MNQTANKSSLLRTLIYFTLLFLLAQLAIFIIHNKVTGLFSSLARSSISYDVFNIIVILPILQVFALHLLGYAFIIAWIWFIAVSIGEWFKLSGTAVYWLGILFWLLACICILSLNYYYFPGSLFSRLLGQVEWYRQMSHLCLILSSLPLLIATVIAYCNFFRYGRHWITGSLLILLIAGLNGFSFYTRFIAEREEMYPADTKPNIIFIGMDSVRPDHTGYFGNTIIHSKNIDHFLQTATTYTDAYTPLARTFPAWMSILTGKYPKHNSARNNLTDPRFVYKNDTLAKHLQAAGYETIYATDENRFSNITPVYGFDKIIGPRMGADDFILGGLSDFPLNNLLVNLSISKYLYPYNYANRAIAYTYKPDSFLHLMQSGLEGLSGKPVFLAVHLCITHWPFTWAHEGARGSKAIPWQYSDSVERLDRQLGDLLALLQDRGLLQHSLVVLLSDHGTALGMPGDRVINQQNYIGDWSKTYVIDIARQSPDVSLDRKHDNSMSISYGHGTDILSLKQYQVLLAIKGFGIPIQAKNVNTRTALIDLAPTVLDYLQLPPIDQTDGESLKEELLSNTAVLKDRPIFMETGDTIDAIETNHIQIARILKERADAYRVNGKTGLVYLDIPSDRSMMKTKQRAILMGDWLLVWYPIGKPSKTTPYDYVLVNLKTHQWSIGFSSPFARNAPVEALLQGLKAFYGSEIVDNAP